MIDVHIPIVDIVHTKDSILITSVGSMEDVLIGLRFEVSRSMKSVMKYDKNSGFVTSNEGAQWQDGNFHFINPTDQFLDLLCMLFDDIQRNQAKLHVPFVSILLYGSLEDLKDYSSEVEWPEKVNLLKPEYAESLELERPTTFTKLKVECMSQSGPAQFFILIDLQNQQLIFQEKDTEMRRSLIEAFTEA